MTTHSENLRWRLRQEPMSARQLVDRMEISQSTVSRALQDLGDEIVRVKNGRTTLYALTNNSRGYTIAPIYRVTEEGRVKHLGDLIPVFPNGYVMRQTDGVNCFSDSLPWWLDDMRPQGYLGRAYASSCAEKLGLHIDPRHWDDSDVIRALLAYGHDAIGNLLIGELAREHFINMPEPTPAERTTAFPRLAAESDEQPGSSAGGEQPKFCSYTERGHVLVKFTDAVNNAVSERWRDLLMAEHLALDVLGVETEIFDFGVQRFLEIPRFDRVGPIGRKAVISLRAIEAEFVGGGSSPWPVLVNRLVAEKCVTEEASERSALLWAYGVLIGNTDMHNGNLSFIGHGRPYDIAPAYDILPMAFAPRTGGGMANTLRQASLLEQISGDIWREALGLAQTFMSKVINCDRFSENFAPCIETLDSHINEAASRIARID